MPKLNRILTMVGFNNTCPYRTFAECLEDKENLFDKKQKLKLSCLKKILLELWREREKNNETK